MQQHIEQSAQKRNLGTFQQQCLESCSLTKAWGYTLLFGLFIAIWSVALIPLSSTQLLQAWPILLFSIVWFALCGSIIYSSWQSYKRKEWIYLYQHGFIYDTRDQCQVYCWSDIDAIRPQYQFSLYGKNQSTLRLYQIQFTNGETLNLVKGAFLQPPFARYQQLPVEAKPAEFDPS